MAQNIIYNDATQNSHNPEVAGSIRMSCPRNHQDPVWKDRVFSCVKARQKCRSFLMHFSIQRIIFFSVLTKKTGGATSKCRGPRRSFLRANRHLRGTFFNVSVRDLSVFCPGKSWLCCFPLACPPVFFARKPPQNLPAGESGLKICKSWLWKRSNASTQKHRQDCFWNVIGPRTSLPPWLHLLEIVSKKRWILGKILWNNFEFSFG